MESQNKLFEEFKAAAAADEQTTFPAQDKLWRKIEQQLDKQETKSIKLFSFAAIKYMAAALVLITGLAVGWNYFFDGNDNEINVAEAKNTPVRDLVKMEQSMPVISPQTESGAVTQAAVKNPVIFATDFGSRGAAADKGTDGGGGPQLTLGNFSKGPESFKERLDGNTVSAASEAPAVAVGPAFETANPAEDFPEERLLKVQGVIVDKAGVALANARINIAGTDKTVTSDAEGKFALNVPDTAAFIVVQSYGNETKYVKVSERHNYKIEISPDKNNVALLNDIAQYNRTNGMQNLYSSPMNANSIRQELASKQKQQTMLRQAPSADPLIIVNGAPYSGKFSDINSKHIKDMKILPEATARALYGERAKNGVIVITLKKGKSLAGQ